MAADGVSTPNAPMFQWGALGFRSIVTDAITDWEGLFRSKKNEVPPEPEMDPRTEENRAIILGELLTRYFVTFEGWVMEEILLFAVCCYSRKLLCRVTQKGGFSKFLDVLFGDWKPSFYDWMQFLWEFCGHASEMFADVVYLLPPHQKEEKVIMGKVLFNDFIKNGVMPESSCASVIGALVEYPMESWYARKHEDQIHLLSKFLSSVEVGLLCRSLVVHRARLRHDCHCGYKSNEEDCVCLENRVRDDRGRPKGYGLENDFDKEYAFVIMKLILERHDKEAVVQSCRWTQEEIDEFVRSACEIVFSEGVYKEIYQNIHLGKTPRLKQKNARKLSMRERDNNTTRNVDQDYSHSFAQHGGCVSSGCKQASKSGCANVSCKQHCVKYGYINCRVHRNYTPREAPTYAQRPCIEQEPLYKTNEDRAFPTSREGNI